MAPQRPRRRGGSSRPADGGTTHESQVRSSRDAKTEVERLHGLRQLADRDVVDAGERIGSRVVKTDLAGDLHLGAPLNQRDRLPNLARRDRKSTRLNSSHSPISYA